MKKILVALSGGVDSAAACLLLQQQGYTVGGATMLLRDGGEAEAEDARLAAAQMGIPFHCFDLRREFEENVIADFTRVYQAGGTPNPCVVCNRTMKFGLFLDKALALGYDGIATGHYVRAGLENGRHVLRLAADGQKDQSYMLWGLSQWQLSHSLFPLGEVQNKEETRRLAAEAGLSLARKHDSQDICFVPDGDYMAYLTSHGLVPQAGSFVSPEGKVYGPHRGMEAYTTGQRRGLGMAFGQRAYVLEKRGTDVVVGPEEGLFHRCIHVRETNWLPFPRPEAPLRVQAKLRYTPKTAAALLIPEENGCTLLFDDPQRAATRGQSAVIYDGDLLLGGGLICGCEKT
ncbi:MAG: tRNA 2-thiouridine(34) synthase MnmA [Oscillospiraceae bacterium]|nr:tRNA 2-thiouridine(34) synthase MnmA [Oscillospiraceae bacterium]